jgi:hypothetical protein
MPDQEAAVVALRLQTMFQKFNLNAHPSYFASIAGEVLAALLKANRRTELLQIAVTAFLSFVVASDKAQVVLSRTTREEFLRQLVFQQKVLGKKFNRSKLLALVEQFAEERDYDLDPIAFIKGFQDHNVIHFDDAGEVNISLPFIETYLLALELADNPEHATSYFDISKSDFDFATFDIYSEVGPCQDVVRHVVSSLGEAITSVSSNEKHILLSDKIHPNILDNRTRLSSIHDRLEKAFDDVAHSRPNSLEKQQLLDVARRIEEGAKTAQEKARLTNSERQDSQATIFRSLWQLGASRQFFSAQAQSGSIRIQSAVWQLKL